MLRRRLESCRNRQCKMAGNVQSQAVPIEVCCVMLLQLSWPKSPVGRSNIAAKIEAVNILETRDVVARSDAPNGIWFNTKPGGGR
jgi:hypothetical protein